MKKRSGLKRTGSMIVFGLISVVILLWTGYLTTSFLSMVLPASFWIVPYLGLVVFDGGMIGWMFVYLYLAEGSMQRSIALGLTVFNLIGVGLMTVAEIVLGGQTLAEVPAMLGTVAIWAVGIWTFVNVAGIVAFHLSSPDARIAAAIQEEKDAVVDEALTDLSNRRHDNAKLLSAQLGGGMFKTLVSELGADLDGDGLPDLAERPSKRGRALEVCHDEQNTTTAIENRRPVEYPRPDEPVSRPAATTARRRKTVIRERHDVQCDYCGKRISPGRNGRRRYCSNAHRTAAYRERAGQPV